MPTSVWTLPPTRWRHQDRARRVRAAATSYVPHRLAAALVDAWGLRLYSFMPVAGLKATRLEAWI